MAVASWIILFAFLFDSTTALTATEWERAFKRMSSKFHNELLAGNIPALLTLYSDDALILPPGSEAIEGKTELEMGFRRNITGQLFSSMTIRNEEILESTEDFAIFTYAFDEQLTPDCPVVVGKGVSLLKEVNARAVMWVDIWNYDS